MMPLNLEGDKCQVWLVEHSHCKLVESTLPYLNWSKIANYVESKLSTWQNIAYLNMNKRCSWNMQETIRTSVKGVIASCSWSYYGFVGH